MIGTESGGPAEPAESVDPAEPAKPAEPTVPEPTVAGSMRAPGGKPSGAWQVRRHRPRVRVPSLAVLALIVVVAVGAFLVLRGPSDGGGTAAAAPTEPAITFSPTPAGPSQMAPPFAPPPGPDPTLTGPPTRVRIKRLGIDSTLEALRLDGKGVLTPPTEYTRAGWYADGTVPGDPGPAVVAGHVNSYQGAGIFARLGELKSGDIVEVARGEAWVSFRVYAVERYAKNRFPTAQVYGPTPDAQLRLITCGGEFDRRARSYLDNVVAYAVRA